MEYQFDYRNTEKWKSHLETQGFVVITNLLTNKEITEKLATFLENFTHYEFHSFIDDAHFSYSDFAWSCRCQPKILDIYRQLYNLDSVDKLLTAIDRGTVLANVPTEESELDEASAYWLHVDYPLLDVAANRDIPPIYQSFLSFVNSGGAMAPGLRVVPASNTRQHHARMLKDTVQSESDHEDTFWCLAPQHVDEVEHLVVPVVSPAGSLTLWKSGIIHDNSTAIYRKVLDGNPGEPLSRLVVYLCYAPRSWATAEELQLRQAIYKAGQITTHWPLAYLSLHEPNKYRWAWKKILDRYPVLNTLIPLV